MTRLRESSSDVEVRPDELVRACHVAFDNDRDSCLRCASVIVFDSVAAGGLALGLSHRFRRMLGAARGLPMAFFAPVTPWGSVSDANVAAKQTPRGWGQGRAGGAFRRGGQ